MAIDVALAVQQDPRTPMRERKRMAALLLEDVTLLKDDAIKIHVRFRGGMTTNLSLPLPRKIWQVRTTSPQAMDRLAQPPHRAAAPADEETHPGAHLRRRSTRRIVVGGAV